MTPREVIPAEISEEVETEVSIALNKMVADERRFSTPDPRIEKLKAALIHIYAWHPISVAHPHQTISAIKDFARKTVEDDDALLL